MLGYLMIPYQLHKSCNFRMGVSDELKKTSMRRIVTYFEAFYRNLFDGAEIKHKNQHPNRDSNPRPPG
jgi:hypothetical protein